MKTIIYVRVSSEDQNLDRQINALTEWATKTGANELEVISEKISGSVSTTKRRFNEILERSDVARVVVQDLDRLGRDTIDILTTIRTLTEKKINLTVTSLGMDTILPNGNENDAFKIVLSVMSTIAELERKKIKERQKQGIAAAKKKGKYKGRAAGSVEEKDAFLSKHQNVVSYLKKDKFSLREISRLCDVSVNTVQKVKKIM